MASRVHLGRSSVSSLLSAQEWDEPLGDSPRLDCVCMCNIRTVGKREFLLNRKDLTLTNSAYSIVGAVLYALLDQSGLLRRYFGSGSHPAAVRMRPGEK